MRLRRWHRHSAKILLDTNAVLWRFADDPANTIFVSAASAKEICTKVRIGKLPAAQALCVCAQSKKVPAGLEI